MSVLRGNEILEALREIILSTKEEVKIASAWIKGEVLKELLSNLKEGVQLEVIVRASSLKDLKITDPEVFQVIREKNGKVFLSPELHAKFVIVDRKAAVVGSSNLTHLGLLPDGNIEAAALVKEKRELEKLNDYFENIRERSYDISRTVGITLYFENARRGKALILKKLQEESYVGFPLEDGNFLLGRISQIGSFNLSLGKLQESSTGKFLSEREENWKVASLFGLAQEGAELKVADVEILGEYGRERELFKTPVRTPKAGSPLEFLKEKEESFKAILLKNHSGYEMKFPTYLGKLKGTEYKGFLDMDKVITMHMAVIGTTGSGKTTFVKKILKNLSNPIKVFIFDIYGEYAPFLSEFGNVKEVNVKNVLLPVSGDGLKGYLKEYGINISEKTIDEKEIMNLFRRTVKPELSRTGLKEKSLETLLTEAVEQAKDRYLKESLTDVIDYWRANFGEESVKGQPELVKELEESLNCSERFVVYNFSSVDVMETRINVAGLVMRELLKIAKGEPANRLVILEEAQNFAPERGTSDVPFGRDNLAYVSAKRIAMEGRKLRLGLIAITQRPANLSKFILSQLNTQVIFKLMTKNDLEAVSPFFEASKEDLFNLLPFLKPGTGYISGLAVPFSFLFQMEEIPYW